MMDVPTLVQAVTQMINAPIADFPQIMQQIQAQQAQQDQQNQQQQAQQQPQTGGGQGMGAIQPNAIMAQNGMMPQTSTPEYQNAKATARAQRKGQ